MQPKTDLTPAVQQLLEEARLASTLAYAPYSKFTVGAAILGKNGKIYRGFNVENVSYGLTLCAERTAVVHALAERCRDWEMIAVVSPSSVSPCGSCRQFLAEFDHQLPVWIGALDASLPIRMFTLAQLLPDAINSSDLIHKPSPD